MKLELIEIEGFMPYRDRQTIDLRGSRLCSITGDLGIGKSAAATDAITWCFFGAVRGKKRGTHDQVINHKSDKAEVRITLTLDSVRYRVRRTLMRRKSTIDAEGLVEWFDTRAGVWQPIEGTRHINVMENWIRTYMRVRLESFTSSAMLMQNRATALFEAQGAEQLKILVELVGCAFYRYFGDKIDKLAGKTEKKLAELLKQIERFENVTEDVYLEAAATADLAQQALQDATTVRVAASEDLSRARCLERLTADRSAAESEVLQIQDVLAGASELREMLDMAEAAARAKMAVGAYLRMSRATENAAKNLAGAREKIAALQIARKEKDQDVLRAEAQLAERASALREADAELSQARSRLEALQAECRQAEEKAGLEAEAALLREELAQGEARLAGYEITKQTVEARGPLAELIRNIDSLETALHERNVARVEVGSAEALLAEATQRFGVAEAAHGVAEAAVRTAEQNTSAHRTQRERAQAALQAELVRKEERSRSLEGDVCYGCGRPIDAHTQDETRAEILRMDERIAALIVEEETAGRLLRESEQLALQARKDLLAARGEMEKRRHGIEAAQGTLASASSREKERHQAAALCWRAALQAAFHAGLESIDSKAADSKDRLRALALAKREEVEGAEKVLGEMNETRAVLARARHTLTGVEGKLARMNDSLPSPLIAADRRALAEQATALLDEKWQRARTQQQETQEAAFRLQSELARITAESEATEERIRSLEDEESRNAEMLASMREEAAHSGWDFDRDGEPTDVHHEALVESAKPLDKLRRDWERTERARQKEGEARARLELLDKEIGLLEGATSVESAAERLRQAEEQHEAAQKAARESTQRFESVSREKQARERLQQEILEVSGDGALLQRLVAPLGRKGLQSRLVHRALSEIIEEANDVLGRLTQDRLSLELDLGETDDDFRILTRDSYHPDRPMEFAFLSGGQRFSVAIAMAIALGEFMSKHGGGTKLEFLVIDEGFGNLNEEAIDDLLNELDMLSADVHVIVISHTEKVQSFFPDGYHAHWDGKSTRLLRRSGGVIQPAA